MTNFKTSTLRFLCAVAAVCGVVGCGGGSAGGEARGTGGTGGDSSGEATGGTQSSGSGDPATTGGSAGSSAVSSGGASENGDGGATSGGTTSSVSLVLVDDGAECSPVAARACTSESRAAQMVCSAGNVWQWAADCAEGTTCDPRPGLKVGQCVAYDIPCATGCDSTFGELVTCEPPGYVVTRARCPSGRCTDAGTCVDWDPCDESLWDDYGPWTSTDCTLACTVQIRGGDCYPPDSSSRSGVDLQPTMVTGSSAIAVPAAAEMATVAACPDVHVFWVWTDSEVAGSPLTAHFPPEYSMAVVSLTAAKADQAAVEATLCSLGADYVSDVTFRPSDEEAAIIFTRDASAPAFQLSLRESK